jgi:GNAT superfamily N-acetyltransferase
MLPVVSISPYRLSDQRGVLDVILPIQQEEFGVAVTAADQPDLLAIPHFYASGTGGFWVARAGEAVVGTVGLKDIGSRQAALRKMFVVAPFRGRQHDVAAKLLATLIAHARGQGIAEIFLGTTDKFLAAHRFYEKNGFREIAKDALPPSFPLMAVDSKFYVLDLPTGQGPLA